MRYGFGILVALALSGCAATKPLQLSDISDDIVYAADVLYSFECELQDAITNVSQTQATNLFQNQAGIATFTLTVTETDNLRSDLSLTIPVGVAGLTVAGGGGPTRKAVRTIDFKVPFNTSSLTPCSAEREAEFDLTRIEAGLGLNGWVDQLATVFVRTGYSPTYLNYAVEFDIGEAVAANSSLSRNEGLTKKRSVGFKSGSSRTVRHKLVVTIDKVTPVEPTTGPRVSAEKVRELNEVTESFQDRISE